MIYTTISHIYILINLVPMGHLLNIPDYVLWICIEVEVINRKDIMATKIKRMIILENVFVRSTKCTKVLHFLPYTGTFSCHKLQ